MVRIEEICRDAMRFYVASTRCSDSALACPAFEFGSSSSRATEKVRAFAWLARKGLRLLVPVLTLAVLAGCACFRANPLEQRRGAVVLVFDMRTVGDMRSLRQLLSVHDVRATFFAFGQVGRGLSLTLRDLEGDGHELGLAGMRGLEPQLYCSMYGRQKYFQDEFLPQVMGARKCGLNLRNVLLRLPAKAKPETLAVPSFLASKGFARAVDVMPEYVRPMASPASKLKEPVVHAYVMTTNNFDRAQIAALARRNEILVVAPNRQVLPVLLDEARAQGVPFATLGDLR